MRHFLIFCAQLLFSVRGATAASTITTTTRTTISSTTTTTTAVQTISCGAMTNGRLILLQSQGCTLRQTVWCQRCAERLARVSVRGFREDFVNIGVPGGLHQLQYVANRQRERSFSRWLLPATNTSRDRPIPLLSCSRRVRHALVRWFTL